MNKLFLSLMLPIACVIAVPSHYDIRHRFGEAQTHYDINQGENHELPAEFWTQHFGPEFQHAVHLELGQTDLIDTSNAVSKHLPQSKEGNRKRSTYSYVIHKPHGYEHANRTAHNSMKVHLLQPVEVEALEKQMINYAQQNKMAESPVVVNLPESKGSMKSNEHETPVVLNVPPVVYHHSNPSMTQQHYLENAGNSWSYNHNYPLYDSYDNSKTSHMKMQSPNGHMQHRYRSEQPDSANIPPSYEYKNQNTFDDTRQPSHGEQRKFAYEEMHLPSRETMTPANEESKLPLYKDEMLPTKQPSAEVDKDGNKDETV